MTAAMSFFVVMLFRMFQGLCAQWYFPVAFFLVSPNSSQTKQKKKKVWPTVFQNPIKPYFYNSNGIKLKCLIY